MEITFRKGISVQEFFHCTPVHLKCIYRAVMVQLRAIKVQSVQTGSLFPKTGYEDLS